MKKTIIILSILTISIFMTASVFAEIIPTPPDSTPPDSTPPDSTPPDSTPPDSTPPDSQSTSLNITNPLGGVNDITTLAGNIINFLIILAIPITAILIVYAGYLYITSAGNDEKVKTAQKTLIWAIIGFAVVLIASSIPTIIQEFLSGKSTSTAPIIYEDPELPSGPGLPPAPLPAI